MSERTERVSALLQAELSDVIRRELRDPRIGGLLTVTHVDVAPDLKSARAYISVMGTDEEQTSTMEALEHARPFVRRELGKRLRMRSTPDVRFIADGSMQKAQELTELMRTNAAERGERI
jgi:ribosome-binding factor A